MKSEYFFFVYKHLFAMYTEINPLLDIVFSTIASKRPNVYEKKYKLAKFYYRTLEAYADFFRTSHHDNTTRIPDYYQMRKDGVYYEIMEHQECGANLDEEYYSQLVSLLNGEFPLDEEGKSVMSDSYMESQKKARDTISRSKAKWDNYIKNNSNADINEKIDNLLTAYAACTCEVYLDYDAESYDEYLSNTHIKEYQYVVLKWLATF
jgi:hypothetical protein